MPETSMDKNDCVVPGKNDVWFTPFYLLVDPESQPHSVQQRSDDHLWFGVFAPNARHHLASRFSVDNVHHSYFDFAFPFLLLLR